jgi:nitrogen-specific signal transduction histidine kinase
MANVVSPVPIAGADEPAKRLPRRLLQVITDLNADLDHQRLFDRICRSCVELTGADAAAFLVIEGEQAFVAAAVGVTRPLGPLEYSMGAATLANLVGNGARHVIPNLAGTTPRTELRELLGSLHTAVLTGVMARGHLVGVLAALYDEVDHRLGPAETELFDFLAGCGGVAIANTNTFDNLVRAEAHHAAVIDGIADGVAVLDTYGLVTAWNKAAVELTGVPAVAAIGRPFPLPVGDPGQPTEHHVGEGRWVELTTSPLDEGYVVAIHDISRQKALDAAKTMFVAATSHELKTPLTVIKSYAEWLRNNIETGAAERRRTAVDAIADSAEELRQIVEKILLTARTEAGAIDLDIKPVEPTRLVRAVATPFEVAGRGHRLVIDLPDALPLVRADIQAVRTALGQLLENAFKYSPNGGTVQVAAELTAEGDAVEVSVSDEGIGLAPGESEYLFMAFYQGETRNRSKVRGGVGLGLSIVRRLIEAMGGRVGASGEPGHGARFWFTLPLDTGLDLGGTDLSDVPSADRGSQPPTGVTLTQAAGPVGPFGGRNIRPSAN